MPSLTLNISTEHLDRFMTALQYDPARHGTKAEYFKFRLRKWALGLVRQNEVSAVAQTAIEEFESTYVPPDIT